MTIGSTVIKPDAASAPAGGTAYTLELLSFSPESREVYVVDANPLSLRKSIVYSKKEPKVSASSPSGYTQLRTNVLVRYPITLASGAITVCTANIQLASDINMSDAQRKELREIVSQAIYQASVDNFWNDASLS